MITQCLQEYIQFHSIFFFNRKVYPEFLPDPMPEYRNRLKEKIEREEMLKRRDVLPIPEFYVGMYQTFSYYINYILVYMKHVTIWILLSSL